MITLAKQEKEMLSGIKKFIEGPPVHAGSGAFNCSYV
jgi:hypothetical protein